ncbi:type III-A CRISPR-associated RAMP protein Csm4 [Thermosulfurimonas dismutans]|uniref:CRISPR system Cms protein Csm4 n=1 Tax=Thermosulfurimonas dismutans TaxID=999894 RepID=A0A179D5P0_9BACT|nr:type III-A CRISPR-associated RAMP protein Csm4 [Thermosulfurimonas dismutans]OAQ20762.1 CRISPR-associated RAMP protein, Csm4 family [Thermosulfurimonas dismutans]
MKYKIFKLKFKGFTHFGETGIDLESVSEWVGSDTLFSAWLNAVSAFWGIEKASEICEKFLKSPPFRISSLFIYYQTCYFLPKPHFAVPAKEERSNIFKIFKKTDWVPLNLYKEWLKGEVSSSIIETAYTIQKERYQRAYKRIIRPRVALDREGLESNLFHEGYIQYAKEGGLWGVVVGNQEGVNLFMKGLALLGEIGLGGERTYGCGVFEVEEPEEELKKQFEELLSHSSPCKVLISRLIPSGEEIPRLENGLEAYKIGISRGWITSGRIALPLKRKGIRFLKEGSVLKESFNGTIVDITPEDVTLGSLSHKIYRYGLALTIPF